MRKKNSLEDAQKSLDKKQLNLKIIEYNGYLKQATVVDEQYGEFTGVFKNILIGQKVHPKRAKLNKKRKYKETCIQKYGVENVSQCDEIKVKRTKTIQDRFGVDNAFQSEVVKEKIKQTNLERYSVEHNQQNTSIRMKTEKTNIKKYGYKNPMQNKQIQLKLKKKLIQCGQYYNIDGYTLKEYYKNSELSGKRAYTTVQQNHNKDGLLALDIDYYNELSGKSRAANQWLAQIEKELGYYLIREYHIPNTLFHADGYDPNTNTIYEFYGDFWHGNLKKFAAEEINPITKTSFQELYNKTIERQNIITNLGYNIISIWEGEFLILLYYEMVQTQEDIQQ